MLFVDERQSPFLNSINCNVRIWDRLLGFDIIESQWAMAFSTAWRFTLGSWQPQVSHTVCIRCHFVSLCVITVESMKGARALC